MKQDALNQKKCPYPQFHHLKMASKYCLPEYDLKLRLASLYFQAWLLSNLLCCLDCDRIWQLCSLSRKVKSCYHLSMDSKIPSSLGQWYYCSNLRNCQQFSMVWKNHIRLTNTLEKRRRFVLSSKPMQPHWSWWVHCKHIHTWPSQWSFARWNISPTGLLKGLPCSVEWSL